jgi:asparagine synthase (glutamine-hydrolysing)
MSGFVALFDRRNAGVDRDRLERMNGTIRHRGPDGGGTWCDDRVGLGHQKLLSTPESRFDSQPHRERGVTITGDARIDNRPELLKRLPVSEPPETVPDSELLMSAYREWGTDCASHVHGAFAFVIWDADESQLFAARDRFGVKPFYYYSSPDTFAAASEKKALLTLPSVPGTVDETKLGDFLLSLYEDTERTFFESLTRLPPAHTMVIDADGTHRRQYWDLDPTRTVTLASDAAYERKFRELFEQAVQSRLRAAGPVGTSLSGGMDSSSVTVLARDLLPDSETLHTFSNVYDETPSSDEREFIEPVIDREGIESHYVFPEDARGLLDPEEMRTYLDQPPHNTMHFAVRERTRRAAENGVGVILGGELGDSAIGYGLGLLPELFWTGRWPHLYRELQAMADIVDAPVSHLFKRHVLTTFVPEPVGRWRRKLRGEYHPLADENPTLDSGFAERIGLQTRYDGHRLRGSSMTPGARRLQRRSLLTGRNATNFEALDLVHAAFGVEPRYPFTDARLLEFSLAIPPTQQFSNGWTRSIMRRSIGDLLPEEVQWRPWKTSVNEAFWNSLSQEEDRITRLYQRPGSVVRYLDPDALETAHREFRDEPTSQNARAIWRALSLSTWLEEYGTNETNSSDQIKQAIRQTD